MQLNCVITEWIENKRFGFTAKSKELEAEGCYRVEPTEGGSRVTSEGNHELKGGWVLEVWIVTTSELP